MYKAIGIKIAIYVFTVVHALNFTQYFNSIFR